MYVGQQDKDIKSRILQQQERNKVQQFKLADNRKGAMTYESYMQKVQDKRQTSYLKKNTENKQVQIQLFPDYSIIEDDLKENGINNYNYKLAIMKNAEEKIIRPTLIGNNINYRYGGSFAAFLQGGGRKPCDIDIEVEEGSDVMKSRDALSQKLGNRLDVKCFHENLCAYMSFLGILQSKDHTRRYEHLINIDVSNEASPQFSTSIKSPKEMSESFNNGDLVSVDDLIINYLDRLRKKPNKKNDDQQIRTLANEDDFSRISERIDEKVKDNREYYKQLLHYILFTAGIIPENYYSTSK